MVTVYNIGQTQAEQPSARNRDHKLANAKAIERSSCPTSTVTQYNSSEETKIKKKDTHFNHTKIVLISKTCRRDIRGIQRKYIKPHTNVTVQYLISTRTHWKPKLDSWNKEIGEESYIRISICGMPPDTASRVLDNWLRTIPLKLQLFP